MKEYKYYKDTRSIVKFEPDGCGKTIISFTDCSNRMANKCGPVLVEFLNREEYYKEKMLVKE